MIVFHTVTADRTGGGELEQPRVDTHLMEYMFAFARQHAHVISVLKIDDTDRARLAADRLGQRVRRRHRRYCRCR